MVNKQLNYRVDEKTLNNFVKACNDERKVVARVLEDLMKEYTKNNKKELSNMKITIESQKKVWKNAFEVEFEGNKYICEGMAEHTNRLLNTVPNYNEPDNDGNYDFEMSDNAVDEDGNEYIVYWIFNTADYDADTETDSYDWDNVSKVREAE